MAATKTTTYTVRFPGQASIVSSVSFARACRIQDSEATATSAPLIVCDRCGEALSCSQPEPCACSASARAVKFLCAHCKIDITGPRAGGGAAPDAGGSCPTCKGHLCGRCAGGWCS